MKAKISQKLAVASIIAAATITLLPLSGLASTNSDQSAEITSLKRQIYACHHHKRHHRSAYVLKSQNTLIERKVIVEKPVVERVIEKEVLVKEPGEIVLERPMQLENKVVVEHAAHRKHLLHMGIPFLSVNLF